MYAFPEKYNNKFISYYKNSFISWYMSIQSILLNIFKGYIPFVSENFVKISLVRKNFDKYNPADRYPEIKIVHSPQLQ